MDACDTPISRRRALRYIAKHGAELEAEFLAEFGDHETYSGKVILDWLGY